MITEGIFLISILLMLFHFNIAEYFSLFNYFDEIICLIVIIRYFILILRGKIKLRRTQFYMLVLIFLISIIGILGNILFEFQSTYYVLIDIFSCFRMFLLYICIQSFDIDFERITKKLNFIFKILTVIIFFFGVINLFVDIGMSYDLRYEIRSYTFLYSNPGSLVTTLVAMIALLNLDYKKNKIWIILNLLSMVFTLRGIGIACCGIYILLRFILNKKVKVNIFSWVIILILCLFLGKNQLETYFFSQETPRSLLLVKSIEIALDYFPFGTGFGTFGSDVTKTTYSQLYYDYNIYKNYWLSKENPSLLTDNYWPMILSQFGIIGMILCILLLYFMYKDISYKLNPRNNISLIFIFVYVIISNIAAQLLAHPDCFVIIMIIYILCNSKKNDLEEKNEKNLSN